MATTPAACGVFASLVGEGNRFGLPPFYQVHVWLWKHNPDGMFANNNPRVSCEFADAVE